MKTRQLVVYIVGGLLAAGLFAWSAMRMARTGAAPLASVAETPAPAAASSSSQSPAQTGSVESVPRISMEDFRQRLDRGEIVAIDVRAIEDYTAAHIPGAIHIPLSFIEGELPYLPRGKPIVTYCT